VRGFVKFAPPDFTLECVGATSDPSRLAPGRWADVEVEGRAVRYLPIVTTAPGDRRGRVPIALRYTLALLRQRRRIDTSGRILNFHRAGVPLAVRDAQVPKVQYVHLNVSDIYRERGESRWRLIPGGYHRVEDLTLGGMARIYVVNQQGVDFYRRRHPGMADRFRFLPTWYDPTIFGSMTDEARAEARAGVVSSLSLADDARILLYVGRLEPQKDPELLMDAFAEARRTDDRLRLVVVGSGGLEGTLRQKVAADGTARAVHFLGAQQRPEIARLMGASDALVLASRFEGMPITVIEALASGLPVVGTAVGEVPRLVHSGRTGWLVEQRTPAALADGIRHVLGMPIRDLRREAIAVASAYRADRVLGPVYEYHRELDRVRSSG
jgi:glycosyltransferase involved in cell wall biosynthesis